MDCNLHVINADGIDEETRLYIGHIMRGISAYESAVKGGFTGTEDEFYRLLGGITNRMLRGAVFMGVAYPQDEVDTTGLGRSFWLAYADGVYSGYGGMTVPSGSDIAMMAFIYDGAGNWSGIPVLAGQFVHGLHNIQPRTIPGAALQTDSVTSAEIATDAVTNDQIAKGAVTADKIAGAAVTTEKIAQDAVKSGNIAAFAVTSRELQDGAVIGTKIPAGTITQDHIIAGNIGYGLLRLNAAFPKVSISQSVCLATGTNYKFVQDYHRAAFKNDIGEMDVVVWLGGDDKRPQSARDWLDASLNGGCTLGRISAINTDELSSAGNPTRRLTYTAGNGMQVAYILDVINGTFEPTKSVMESVLADIESRRIALPRSKFLKQSNRGAGNIIDYVLIPAGAFNCPAELGLPYIGIQTYTNGAWRLAYAIYGVGKSKDDSNIGNYDDPFLKKISDYVYANRPYIDRADENGRGAVPLKQLFRAEFMSIGDILGDAIRILQASAEHPDPYAGTTLPLRYAPERLRIFTRDQRNIGGMPPSAHNLCSVLLEYTGDAVLPNYTGTQQFRVDLVRRGNKQVVRRRYRVGYVWAKQYMDAAKTSPKWDAGYVSSNWTTLQVSMVVYLNRERPQDDIMEVKILD